MLRFPALFDKRSSAKGVESQKPAFIQRIQSDPIEIEPPSFTGDGEFDDKTVTAGIATFPARIDNLRCCVDSLYDQCDYICIYLNGYTYVPEFLKRPKIRVFLGEDYIDLNATGKVFFIDWVKNGYYFTIDDDFVYPADYISHLRSKIDQYGRRCAVTVHGSIFPSEFSWYYERTAMYQYQAPLPTDRFVHLPGSGSFGFHKSTMKANFVDFLPLIMVDLTLAILCKRQQVPIVCVSRPAMWLMNTERSGLFQQFSKIITHHTTYAVKEMPWSFTDYAAYAGDVVKTVFAGLKDRQLVELGLDIDFISAWKKKELPNSWKTTMTTMRRKMDAMKSEFI